MLNTGRPAISPAKCTTPFAGACTAVLIPPCGIKSTPRCPGDHGAGPTVKRRTTCGGGVRGQPQWPMGVCRSSGSDRVPTSAAVGSCGGVASDEAVAASEVGANCWEVGEGACAAPTAITGSSRAPAAKAVRRVMSQGSAPVGSDGQVGSNLWITRQTCGLWRKRPRPAEQPSGSDPTSTQAGQPLGGLCDHLGSFAGSESDQRARRSGVVVKGLDRDGDHADE